MRSRRRRRRPAGRGASDTDFIRRLAPAPSQHKDTGFFDEGLKAFRHLAGRLRGARARGVAISLCVCVCVEYNVFLQEFAYIVYLRTMMIDDGIYLRAPPSAIV